jgi:ABC-type lipoprotein release transport system permease subunit
MLAVVFLVAHDLRARWRGWVVLVVLVAAAGGAVLTAAAGAVRTDSAYPRFLKASKASDLLVAPDRPGLHGFFDALAHLPGARAVAPIVVLGLEPLGHGALGAKSPITIAPIDGRFGRLVDVPKVLAGRLPAAGHADEIAADQRAAAMMGLGVGSVLTMRAGEDSQQPGAGAARPRLLRERVVGIVVTRGSVFPVTETDKVPVMLASPALFHRLGAQYIGASGAYVELRQGTSPATFGQRAQSLTRQYRDAGRAVLVTDEGAQAAAVQHAIRPQAVMLAIFALVLAVTALLIVGQAATRLLTTSAPDNPVLAALGMTRSQVMATGLTEVAVAAAAGALVAAGLAVAASPMMPIGAARLAEPSPGVSADMSVLAAATAAIVVLLAAWTAWPAWRLASSGTRGSSTPAAAGPRSRLAAWLAGAGLPLTAAAGVRLALEEGRGRTAVPVRAALAGTALSVIAVTAAVTFGANLLHLVEAPPLYGQHWDAAIDLQFPSSAITPAAARHRLGRLPGIAGWTFGHHGAVEIGGRVIPAIGLTAGKGPLLSPSLLQGRPPRTGSEIVLGTSTLRQIGRHVGQWVTVTVSGHRLRERIVGRAVFPNFGQGGFTPTDLGQGAETTAAVLQLRGASPGFEFVLLSFNPGPRRAANIASFQRSMTGFCRTVQQTTCVLTSQRPNGITNYASIDRTPAVLAGLLAVVGAAVLGQFIVVSGRRRRRDFAILKALGLLSRQVSAITAWQVSTLTGLALLAGLPLGVAVGRWSWALFGRSLGIPDVALTPIWPVLLMVPAVIVIANAVAFWPGRATAQLKPADVLRAE